MLMRVEEGGHPYNGREEEGAFRNHHQEEVAVPSSAEMLYQVGAGVGSILIHRLFRLRCPIFRFLPANFLVEVHYIPRGAEGVELGLLVPLGVLGHPVV